MKNKEVGEMTQKAEESRREWVIVGHGGYGLMYGRIDLSEFQNTTTAKVYDARNIRRWYGRKGGITSLAAFGPCGPKVDESRIGAPIPWSLVLDVRAIHKCTPEAVEAFAAVKSHEE